MNVIIHCFPIEWLAQIESKHQDFFANGIVIVGAEQNSYLYTAPCIKKRVLLSGSRITSAQVNLDWFACCDTLIFLPHSWCSYDQSNVIAFLRRNGFNRIFAFDEDFALHRVMLWQLVIRNIWWSFRRCILTGLWWLTWFALRVVETVASRRYSGR